MPDREIQKWAKWYTNEANLKRVVAVALVEGKDDKSFWERIFTHTGISIRVHFGSEQDLPDGKSYCLKYLPYVNSHFILCIDSDYDYIKQQRPDCCVGNFVLQTYTYAIENHYLASNAEILEFLQKYSAIIYPAFLAHLSARERGHCINDFCKEILPRSISDEALRELQKTISETYPSQKPNAYAASGLTADNTYLYIKAKQLKKHMHCDDNLLFTHFPMTKIKEDIVELFPTT